MAIYKGAASEAGRAMQLMKKREKELEEAELRRKKIESNLKISAIDSKFAAHYDAVEQQLKSSTIGLVTLEEMKAKQENIVQARERQLARKEEEHLKEKRRQERAKEREKNKQKAQIHALSFDPDADADLDDEDEEKDDEKVGQDDESSRDSSVNSSSRSPEPPLKKVKGLGKDPAVDTSFLPDKKREEEENLLREQLRQEWDIKQEELKKEEIEITFSYWDGSGHRNSVKMQKGHTMYQFLQKALEMLRKQFPELRTVSADQLMYIKEDLIIPHHYSFYDFIVTKARGKSGPLFSFDVHDDIRIINDATVEKEESHAGKVLTRSWYEKNKHIFPASRWEPYDPHKNYEKYTISDGRGKRK